MDKISVIVPVYNVEPYLEACVKSILNSTYRNLELILVDDGSTDGSGGICDTLARTDERVRVIHKENGGASSARNAGIDAAAGDFIGFVDGDDEVSPNMYETLYNDIKKNKAQISVCRYKIVYNDKTFTHGGTNRSYTWNSDEAIEELLSENTIASSVSNKLYAKELFAQVRFDETISYGEDRLTNYYLIKKAEKIVFRDSYLYIYKRRQGSTTTSTFSAKQFSCIEAARKIKNDIERDLPQLRKYGVNHLLKIMMHTYIASFPYKEYAAKRAEIYSEVNEVWKSDRKNIIPRLKAAMILFRLHPALLYDAYKIYKSIKCARIYFHGQPVDK